MPRRISRTDAPPEDDPRAPEPSDPEIREAVRERATTGGDAADDLVGRDVGSDDEDGDAADDELTNGRLGRVFHEIGDILEVKGEIKFKTVAYHRAADAIARAPFPVADAYRAARLAGTKPPVIPGVGAAIADKITELATTGRMGFHERLRAEFPPTLVDLLRLPGIGPKSVKLIYEELGVASIPELKTAAEAGRLRDVKGLSVKTEQLVLEGIERLETRPQRLHIHRAQALADDLAAAVRAVPGVTRVEIAGSLRRRKETIGDLDLLVETTDAPAVIERFTGFGEPTDVIGAGRAKAAIRLLRGPNVDLMVMPPGEAGSYLVHFTGSADHNIRLRGMARDRGWSLSEKGFVRLGEDGQPLEGAAADRRSFADEAGVYAFLDLAEIPPELREDRGEIEAATTGSLPALITRDDLQGDCHSHSDWSDGVHTIEVMAEAARRLGYAYQVLTDHSQSLAIANGLSPERVLEQRAIVAALNERFAAEEAAGTAPAGAHPDGFRLLHGCELEVRADATLDFEDDFLALYDVVVASVHVSRRQPRAQLMARTLLAIRSPHVDIVAHPAGRMINGRDDLDLDWDVVYGEAARTGTALEMNGSPHRLDLAAERARRAVEHGCVLTVDSDAHSTAELQFVRWGIEQARRAWVEPQHVLNTRSRADLLAWVAGKPSRV